MPEEAAMDDDEVLRSEGVLNREDIPYENALYKEGAPRKASHTEEAHREEEAPDSQQQLYRFMNEVPSRERQLYGFMDGF
jgi:hypothetical protein